jgi:hypothetical protein
MANDAVHDGPAPGEVGASGLDCQLQLRKRVIPLLRDRVERTPAFLQLRRLEFPQAFAPDLSNPASTRFRPSAAWRPSA